MNTNRDISQAVEFQRVTTLLHTLHRVGRAITTSEASRIVNMGSRNPSDLQRHIVRTMDVDHRAGRPFLAALIVSDNQYIPSQQFFAYAKKLGYNIPDDVQSKRTFWLDQVTRLGINPQVSQGYSQNRQQTQGRGRNQNVTSRLVQDWNQRVNQGGNIQTSGQRRGRNQPQMQTQGYGYGQNQIDSYDYPTYDVPNSDVQVQGRGQQRQSRNRKQTQQNVTTNTQTTRGTNRMPSVPGFIVGSNDQSPTSSRGSRRSGRRSQNGVIQPILS